MYPYSENSVRVRTQHDYLAAAREALRRSKNGKEVSVDGIKGFSILLNLFSFPDQVILDYMHMCCLGHVPALVRRWLKLIPKSSIDSIDEYLSKIRLPHNINVVFLDSIASCDQWKAKHSRLFILNVGVPIVKHLLPKLQASHFVIYSMAIKLLHSPLTLDEIDIADRLIRFYCKTASSVYDQSIEIFSLHAHLHLPDQVP